jgi:hypothetical protein
MPNEFTVVGENNDDESQFLVVGADGNYYGYSPSQERFVPVVLDDQWTVFASSDVLEDVPAAKEGAEP